MYILLLNVITLCMVLTTVTEVSTTEVGPCILPPYPDHGSYNASPEASPGDHLEAVVLNVTCNKGYNLVGERRVSCLSGWWSIDMDELAESCLPFCESGGKPGVVTCAAKTPKCLITLTNLPSLGARSTSSEYMCGYTGPESEQIIAGGSRVDFYESPWHAGIYTKNTKPYMQICGGTLISRDVIVSAAHCFSVDGTLPSVDSYAVAVGKIYRPWNNDHDKGAQKSDVKEIRIPPRYLGSVANFQDDIAVVIATKQFFYDSYVRPACVSFDYKMDDEQLREGNLGRVFGWGLVGENSRSSQVLMYADLPYVNVNRCIRESPMSFKSSITSDKFCAGYTNGTSVCRGDSGGGLMFPKFVGNKLRYFLRGIVSTSPSTENACNIYTWATFTHILNHERFLKLFIDTDEQQPHAVEASQPASVFGNSGLSSYNLDYRIATKKPTYDGWI